MVDTNTIESSVVQDAHLSVLGPLFEEACVELAAAYGVHVQARSPAAAPFPPCELAARVYFRGKEIWGDIGISFSPAFAHASLSSALTLREPPSQRALRDWSGELTNQLVGRLKNKLRPYEVSFELGVPQVLSPSEGRRLKGELVRHFAGDAGGFSAYLTVRVAPGVVLRELGGLEPLDEGDLLLF